MSAALAAIGAFLAYFLASRFYSRFLARRLFAVDGERVTPAHSYRDGVDHIPTNRFVLFGHHWASITGLAPMLGPAMAVIWGWGPAMLWVVFGAIFVGCVHDFGALMISLRGRGLSVGKVAEGVIGPRAKLLFLVIIYFGISLAMGVFTIAIADLFSGPYPTAVLPSGGLMIVAAIIGWLVVRRGARLGPLAGVGFVLLLGLIALGHEFPIHWASKGGWKTTLLAYAFIASVLPVWSLLQPRDFLNSLLLYLGLALAYAGFFVQAPEFAAPMVNPEPKGAPPLFPFVFITIACGAASGFHGLVASGTTSKQLDRETDAPFVGYGGMVGESLLGLLAVLATAAGFAAGHGKSAAQEWQEHYGHWSKVSGSHALRNFIDGTARFIENLGVDHQLAMSFIAVFVVSFALTTLDSATRLLRYNVAEIGDSIRMPFLGGRVVASLLAVLSIGFFAFYEVNGQPMARVLWRLFGTTNQLLGALTLLTVTLYLFQRRRPCRYTAIPMVLMLVTTLIAMIWNLRTFSNGWAFDAGASWPLLGVGAALILLALWLVIEAVMATRRCAKEGSEPRPWEVFAEDAPKS